MPLYSSAEFDDIFPEARTRPTGYRSRLGGDRAWLAEAVTDYFANGGEKLWVIPVPEVERQAGFLPAAGTRLHDTRSLRGLAVALVLEEVAVLALPDLERLQVPAELPFPPPRVRLDNPQPAFLPCGEEFDDGHREHSPPPRPHRWPPPDCWSPWPNPCAGSGPT